MTIGVLKEPSDETRVSLLPEAVAALSKKGISILIENGAGENAFADDESYQKVGAQIKPGQRSFNLLKLFCPFNRLKKLIDSYRDSNFKSKILIGVYFPLYEAELMQQWAEQGITCFSLDMLPRTTRAQTMDVLSSQANIAGYKAALEAANLYSRYFPMFMTAAGTDCTCKGPDPWCGCCGFAGDRYSTED